jgi:hypothetical protein
MGEMGVKRLLKHHSLGTTWLFDILQVYIHLLKFTG